jgi:ring-1,2-phenylacetyl-CoA epoxidase subunit PaaC
MDAKKEYILQIADNALILSHRLSEYCSRAPFLEEDLANTNVALDLIGIAESAFAEAAKLEGLGRSGDDLAYRRGENEYRNVLLVEQPNTDFAYIMVRQFLTDAFHVALFTELTKSKDEFLSALAFKSIKEVTYHLKRSSEWMIRLGDGTEEANVRTQAAIDHLWKFSGEFFVPSNADQELVNAGLAPNLKDLASSWKQKVNEIFFMAKLRIPESEYQYGGGKQGVHTEHLGHILTEMQYLPIKYPDAVW